MNRRCFLFLRLPITRGVAVVALCCVAVGCLPLHAEESGLTPDQVATIRSVRSARISPDGRSVAYILSVPRRPAKDDDGPDWAELHVYDEKSGSRPFITGEVNVVGVDWTPDGTGISFLAKRGKDEHRALYVIPVDGGEARRRLEHGDDIRSYSWAPDGGRVAFLARDAEDKKRKKKKEQGFKQQIYEEDVRSVRVWVADLDAETVEPRALDLAGSGIALSWSPAGDQLAVSLAPSPLIDDQYMYTRVYVVDSETGRVSANLNNPGKLGAVRWSPDGKHLAMISGADINDPGQGRLLVGAASGGDLRDVLPGYLGHVSAIAWQDVSTLMFIGDEGVWTTFGEVGADGSARKIHVAAGGPVLLSFSVSGDGQRAAFVGQTPTHPSELFVMQYGDAAPRRVTDSNPWLADVPLGKQEVIRYQARDGLEIEGLLIRALDEKPDTRYPLILTVHGGPESHYRNGWLTRYATPGQMGAARGYAVFYPNYRGSTGRGVEFSKMSQADPAGKEFDDVVDGVDHLIKIGLVDKDRVGVTGGSYGGYATAWCCTFYSDRFAAGVMFVGISDKVSKTGTTDIPNEEFLVHSRRRPWDDWDFFLQRSPIYHAEKARSPLLILHGKDDPRVHVSQSMAMYRNLKLRGSAPVRLVLYPGEGHGNRKAAARYDYSLRMLRWFDHYLKGAGGAPPAYEIDYGLAEEDDEDDEADSD